MGIPNRSKWMAKIFDGAYPITPPNITHWTRGKQVVLICRSKNSPVVHEFVLLTVRRVVEIIRERDDGAVEQEKFVVFAWIEGRDGRRRIRFDAVWDREALIGDLVVRGHEELSGRPRKRPALNYYPGLGLQLPYEF